MIVLSVQNEPETKGFSMEFVEPGRDDVSSEEDALKMLRRDLAFLKPLEGVDTDSDGSDSRDIGVIVLHRAST